MASWPQDLFKIHIHCQRNTADITNWCFALNVKSSISVSVVSRPRTSVIGQREWSSTTFLLHPTAAEGSYLLQWRTSGGSFAVSLFQAPSITLPCGCNHTAHVTPGQYPVYLSLTRYPPLSSLWLRWSKTITVRVVCWLVLDTDSWVNETWKQTATIVNRSTTQARQTRDQTQTPSAVAAPISWPGWRQHVTQEKSPNVGNACRRKGDTGVSPIPWCDPTQQMTRPSRTKCTVYNCWQFTKDETTKNIQGGSINAA